VVQNNWVALLLKRDVVDQVIKEAEMLMVEALMDELFVVVDLKMLAKLKV